MKQSKPDRAPDGASVLAPSSISVGIAPPATLMLDQDAAVEAIGRQIQLSLF